MKEFEYSVWQKFHPEVQEKLFEKYQGKIILTGEGGKPKLRGKARIINILNQIDFTTKEGQANFDKYIGKFEDYMKKFDRGLDKADKAFGNVEKKISGGTGKGKSIIDRDILDNELLGGRKADPLGKKWI